MSTVLLEALDGIVCVQVGILMYLLFTSLFLLRMEYLSYC